MLEHIKRRELVEDTIGIFLTRPDLASGKSIINSLGYYHHLTSRNINFYLPGYGAYWNPVEYPDMEPVTNINGANWSYSNKAFVDFVNELEDASKWKYSGESELLIIPYQDGFLDFEKVLVFHLDAMLRDETIDSISGFITSLSRTVRKNNNVKSISGKGVAKSFASTIMEEIENNLPNILTKTVTKGKHYICKDLSK